MTTDERVEDIRKKRNRIDPSWSTRIIQNLILQIDDLLVAYDKLKADSYELLDETMTWVEPHDQKGQFVEEEMDAFREKYPRKEDDGG